MLHRIYMLFPRRSQAVAVVDELMVMGIAYRNMHTIAGDGIDIRGLPPATVRQRNDYVQVVENVFWRINLAAFLVAFIVLMAASMASSPTVAAVSLAVMLLTFILGYYFASYLPHAHLLECENAIKHGEILLLVDVPKWRVHAVERLIKQKHPEMDVCGQTWVVQGL